MQQMPSRWTEPRGSGQESTAKPSLLSNRGTGESLCARVRDRGPPIRARRVPALLQHRPRPHRPPHQRPRPPRHRLRCPQNGSRPMNACRYISGIGQPSCRTRDPGAIPKEPAARLRVGGFAAPPLKRGDRPRTAADRLGAGGPRRFDPAASPLPVSARLKPTPDPHVPSAEPDVQDGVLSWIRTMYDCLGASSSISTRLGGSTRRPELGQA
jgi:hypothetical protein